MATNGLPLSVLMDDVRNRLDTFDPLGDDDAVRRTLTILRADSVLLAEKIWDLHVWLVRSDDWLAANPTHPDYARNEDRWLRAVKRYQAAMDLLAEIIAALEQHPPRATVEQVAMPMAGMAASGHTPHWEV